MSLPLIQIQQLKKSFRRSEGQVITVLDHLDLKIYPDEIISLIGRSGSGKSTLLRLIAGLDKPSSGELFFEQDRVQGPVPGISMVFQSFALMPWLTVLQNVELGLEAMGLGNKERRERALEAIDKIGLDGFESAYPKELSGGMRQRVGFARALVVKPKVLLMDEPFSALDILTAETLRKDLMDIWGNRQEHGLKSILFVTHNIEEAAEVADRILIFGSDPGYIKAELPLHLPYPRKDDTYLKTVVDDIYFLMTTPLPQNKLRLLQEVEFDRIELNYKLPDAEPSQVQALVAEIYASDPDRSIDLPVLVDVLHLEVDDLFSITEALQLLDFAKVSRGDISLTEQGKFFAKAGVQEAKEIFAKQLTKRVPLVNHVATLLQEQASHKMKEDEVLSILKTNLGDLESERVFKVLVSWARYAEIFAYDYESGYLSLENPS